MMRCDTCSHECTVVDFMTLRNVCEHLYLDSLAKKQALFLASATMPMYCRKDEEDFFSRTHDPEARVELLRLRV